MKTIIVKNEAQLEGKFCKYGSMYDAEFITLYATMDLAKKDHNADEICDAVEELQDIDWGYFKDGVEFEYKS